MSKILGFFRGAYNSLWAIVAIIGGVLLFAAKIFSAGKDSKAAEIADKQRKIEDKAAKASEDAKVEAARRVRKNVKDSKHDYFEHSDF